MKKIKKVNNYFNNKGNSFEETLENLIFSYLEEENGY